MSDAKIVNKKSKRTRKKTVEVTTSEPPLNNRLWTTEDKRNLLDGLRKYGHTDIENITAMLPNKSTAAVRVKINKLMRQSAYIEDEHSALGKWINSGHFEDKNLSVPLALKFISVLEKHPTPEMSAGFDFRAAYDFLYRVTMGLPAVDLPAETSTKFYELFKEVSKQVWPADEKEILVYLGNLNRRRHTRRCYRPSHRLTAKRMIGPDKDELNDEQV